MAVKYGECHITLAPAVTARCTRKRNAEVSVAIMTACAPQTSAPAPIQVIIKGEKFAHVMELLALSRKSDAEIAALVRASPLADEVAGKTDAETAAWVRDNVAAELVEMAEERDGKQETSGGPQA